MDSVHELVPAVPDPLAQRQAQIRPSDSDYEGDRPRFSLQGFFEAADARTIDRLTP
jgi:hypothetical protein